MLALRIVTPFLCLVLGFWVAAALSIVIGLLHHHALTLKLQPAFHIVAAPGDALELTAIVVFLLSMFYKTVKAVNPDARRRLLLLDTAAIVGLLPFVIVFIVCSVLSIPFQGWYAAIAIAMLFIFPVTMAYVIVVDRAMEVRVVVRQGVQYLLATGGIRVLQAAISIGIIVAAVSMPANTSALRRVLFLSLGFELLAAVGGLAQRLRGWIDRRFFRDAYEADAILADLAAKVRTMVETAPLLETVASRVAAALHVPRITPVSAGAPACRRIGLRGSVPARSERGWRLLRFHAGMGGRTGHCRRRCFG